MYRYIGSPETFDVVELAGWRATFAIRPGSQPLRVTPWKRA
jgi:hypothetical protein